MTAVPGWRILTVSAIVVVSAMLLPVAAGLGLAVFDRSGESGLEYGFRGDEVFWTTMAWSIAIAGVATILAVFPAAGFTGSTRDSRRHALGIAVWLMPLLLPPALFFDAWWLELGPDSMIGRAAAENGRVPLLRRAVLAVGLLGMATPLAMWLLVAGRDPVAGRDERLILLDRPRLRAVLMVRLRRFVRPAMLAWLVTAAVVAGLTVPFDLAQVRSWGFELRTLDTRGAGPGTLLEVGLPGLAIAVLAGVALARLLHRTSRHAVERQAPADAPAGRTRGSVGRRIASGVIWSLLVGWPLLMLLRRAWSQDLEVAWSLHREALGGTLVLAAGGGLLGSIIAVGFAAWRGGGVRGVAGGPWPAWALFVPALAILAAMPATLLAVGVEAVWNIEALGTLVDGPVPTILAVAGRTAIAAAIVGWMIGGRLGSLPRLDAPRGMRAGWTAGSPIFTRAAVTGLLLGGTLAAGEIPVAARVRPPGFPTLTGTLLDAMHYQYADSVLPVVLGLVAAATIAAVLMSMVMSASSSPSARVLRSGAWLLSTLVILGQPGCGPGGSPSESGGVPHAVAFGRPGNIDGRFDYPRAIALDEPRGRIYVVDKSARVQRFALDGTLEAWWRMPSFENGKPTGIAVDAEGRVLVADTHEQRISIFSPAGELLETHGVLGTEAGEFIYPTDVVGGPGGIWFVSEYGGNDRVQIFDPEWNPIGVIGRAAEEDLEADGRTIPGLSRPQSLAWDDDAEELFIADAIHHRIVVVDATGDLLRTLGGPGLEPGRLGYPYDIALEPDGTLLVVEYGNNRVQRLDVMTGESRGIWGGTGTSPGKLRYPWGLDAGERTMVVLDSGNSRVLVGPRP